MNNKRVDMTGTRFGRLVVITDAENKKIGRKSERQLICKCDCGNSCIKTRASLMSGRCNSCGCLHTEATRERRLTHGLSGTPEYKAWINMICRCHDPESRDYPNYGGRGITVCERWLNDVAAFIEDMGLRPSTQHSLDRLDNDKGYSPDNCQWRLDRVQSNNRRGNILLEFDGQTRTLSEWAYENNIDVGTLAYRIKANWPIEKALTTPGRK